MRFPRSKGISGILAAVVFFTIVIVAFVPYLSFVVSSNSQYDKAQAGRNNRAIGAQSENIQISTFLTSNLLTFTVTNIGGVSLNLSAEFEIESAGYSLCPSCTTPITLSPVVSLDVGQYTTQPTVPAMDCSNANQQYPCKVEVVTSRGRVFSQTYPMPIEGVIDVFTTSVSTTTQTNTGGNLGNQGIGPIGMDFTQFWAYTCGSGSKVTPPCTLSDQINGYSVPGVDYPIIVFAVVLQNLDPCQRTITLGSQSVLNDLELPAAGSKSLTFNMVNGPGTPPPPVSGGTVTSSGWLTLPYMSKQVYYFASLNPKTGTNAAHSGETYSVALYLTGSTSPSAGTPASCQTGNFGQNIPLVTTSWT